MVFILLSFFTFGQNKDSIPLHSRFRPGLGWLFTGFGPAKKNQNVKYDRLMIDLAYNSWYGDRKFFSSPWQSIGFTISWMFDFPMTRNDLASFGLGLAYSHYNNRSNLVFHRNFTEGNTSISEATTNDGIQKRKFAANYIEIPLGFRIRSRGWQHFKLMIGGKIGYNFNSFYKETKKIKGKSYRTKYKNFPDLNPIRYGVTFRIGIRNWALFGAYYFSPLFKNKESVQLYPFSLGITLSLF